ncbi:NfeD family protein [Ramlibacter sp. USB13]|uniref:NfeD family protein n=1 Tax=Ramlibacter cellulosilyticus TaxID=2764187 RepID=A0A923MQU4_9BURK|nr:NfeD family protein [Ramlibacter cellulosilyticus]MBC5783533.1 NfeD family protein [Ramlibacter cellulosilyticus]
MADWTFWWLLAGAAVAVELLTGTFYLLMLGIGMAAGALAAHAGASMTAQVVAAAIVGGGAVAGWHVARRRRIVDGLPGNNMDFDAGERVHVDAWTADNTSTVRYRGTVWTAVPAGGTPQGTGPHCVRQVDGSRLVVEKI